MESEPLPAGHLQSVGHTLRSKGLAPCSVYGCPSRLVNRNMDSGMADLLSRARRSSRARSANNWCKAGVHSIRPRRGAEGFDAFPSGTARARLLLVPSNRRQGLRRGVVVLDTKREGRRRSSDVPVRSYGSGRALHAQASCDLWRLYAVDGHCRKARQDFLCSRRCRRLVCAGSGRSCRSTGPVSRGRPGDGVGIRRAAGFHARQWPQLQVRGALGDHAVHQIRFHATLGPALPLPESRESWYAQQAAVARLKG